MRTIEFKPDGFSVNDVNARGLPANVLGTESILTAVGSFTGYARMNVYETNDTGGEKKIAENHLFYWFFESRMSAVSEASEASIPVIIWLNGGPGSSSLAGLFMENGPLKLGADPVANIVENPFGWNKACHLLYWDQPVGTGFSYTLPADKADPEAGYMNDEDELSREFCTALDQFFGDKQFQKFRKCPLYLAGESYAGKYIPNIACEMMGQKDLYKHIPPLTGTAIGDGWMLPGIQTFAQIRYGYEMGFLDSRQYSNLRNQCMTLQKQINEGCFDDANDTGNRIMSRLLSCGGEPNIYDVRTYTGLSTTLLGAYLNNEGVKTALGVTYGWQCADNGGPVADHLKADVYAPADEKITRLLDHARKNELKVLFYTGNFDMSCGFRGTEDMLWAYDFPNIEPAEFTHIDIGRQRPSVPGGQSWRELDRKVWVMPPDKTLGFVKSFGNLTQVVVVNSGHLAPMDRPRASRSMINHWIFDIPFPVIKPAIDGTQS